MPGRKIPLVTDQYYHVYNRGIDRRVTFGDEKEYRRALEGLEYYLHASAPVSLSIFNRMNELGQQGVRNYLKLEPKLTKVIAFCLMPNHFHLLVQQLMDGGISKLMSNFQNSYTRYFNVKNERTGTLFDDQFKAIRVETDEQLIHLSRYIHLNPFASYIANDDEGLLAYPWSSLKEYVGGEIRICDPSEILAFFGNAMGYQQFVLDRAGYQHELEMIKHLMMEGE